MKLGYQAGAWKDMDLAAREIREAGYEFMEVFGLGRHDGNPESFFTMLQENGVQLCSIYTGIGFNSPESYKVVDRRVTNALDLLKRSGSHELVVGGCWRQHEGESEKDFKRVCDGLNSVGKRCIETGVRLCYHPHAGTVFVTNEDMEKFFNYTDPELVFLGPDTAHLAKGGIDPVEFFRRNAQRIKYVHFKDYDPASGAELELGQGSIDFPQLMKILRDGGYAGYVVVEHVSEVRAAIESARMSRRYAREVLRI